MARSEAAGDRLVEARYINKSLSALGSVMAALASGASHVPFRDSKLTALLQDSLSGNAKALMFIHVSPEVWHTTRRHTTPTILYRLCMFLYVCACLHVFACVCF